MTQLLNRRSVIVGTVAAAFPLQANASPEHAHESFQYLAEALQGLHGLEITGRNFEPFYRHGTMIFIRPEDARPSDHVCVIQKTGPHVIAQLVHQDAKALYVRGFQTGDRMQAIPLKAVSQWGRIVVAFKP
jgi:hypothetical protein